MTAEGAVQRRDGYPAELQAFAAFVNSAPERSVLMQQGVREICRLTGAEAGSLLLVDEFTSSLDFEVVWGEQSDLLPFFRVPKGAGIAGWVAEHDTPLLVADVQADERFYAYVDQQLQFTTREMIAVPLRSENGVIGVVQIINRLDGPFTGAELELATAFANLLEAGISREG